MLLPQPDGPMTATSCPARISAAKPSYSSGRFVVVAERQPVDLDARRARRAARVRRGEYGSAGAFMTSPKRAHGDPRLLELLPQPDQRSIGCDSREANIWNATSMPIVKLVVVITSQAPSDQHQQRS